MAEQITYGPGGFDPTKPNDNIVERTEVPDDDTPPADGRLDALLSDLAKATSLAQVRAAAAKAAEA